MKPEAVSALVGTLPYMRLERARIVHQLILTHHLRNCLELGFYHGVSSAYIAGALQELGGGKLTTIDLERAKQLSPNIEDTLRLTGLVKFVDYYFESSSYHWRLMKFLEAGMQETFDLCYIDGGHTWSSTGFAYFLCARLLKPSGWIIFDDLDWTFDSSLALSRSDKVKRLSDEERTTPQVRKVYELLVKSDPRFGDFVDDGRWGFARKIAGPLK
jgi:predicted O-methyltransferase YrrM